MLLADGRLPAGGHAHSAGVEAAIGDGRVVDEGTLEAFVRGRLLTTGLVEAATTAATVLRLVGAGAECPGAATATAAAFGDGTRASTGAVLVAVDAELQARILAPPLQRASRRLGRQLVRVGSRCWPHPLFTVLAEVLPAGAHQPVAMGVTALAAGLGPRAAAELAVHHAISTPAQAAVKLLGLDPYAVAAMTARIGPEALEIVSRALAAAFGPLAELPARSGPLLELAALDHDRREQRMFAT